MERELQVYVDVKGAPVLAGKLWSYLKGGRQSALFVYEEEWLARKDAFALAPSLMLSKGRFYSVGDIHGPFSDTAPDSWGRDLMRFDEQTRAKKDGVALRTLYSIDFLAGVSDEVRLGAIRFKNAGGTDFLAAGRKSVPRIIEIKQLLAAADRIDRGKPRASDLAIVLDPGSALGGARPKAVVRDTNGDLLLAKFTSNQDTWPVILWEAVLLGLRRKRKLVSRLGGCTKSRIKMFC